MLEVEEENSIINYYMWDFDSCCWRSGWREQILIKKIICLVVTVNKIVLILSICLGKVR